MNPFRATVLFPIVVQIFYPQAVNRRGLPVRLART
jgi:hypothetical protein